MKKLLLILLIGLTLIFAGCTNRGDALIDGYYTAQTGVDSRGWQEYVAITVRNGKIVATEFNAKNASGFIKAWDNRYMELMLQGVGTYPNQYTRYYAAQLLEKQSADGIDIMTGASSSGDNFLNLSAAVLARAKAGDETLITVE